ncbi:unnamed protein product, partial [Amoebophrya sp. A25]
ADTPSTAAYAVSSGDAEEPESRDKNWCASTPDLAGESIIQVGTKKRRTEDGASTSKESSCGGSVTEGGGDSGVSTDLQEARPTAGFEEDRSASEATDSTDVKTNAAKHGEGSLEESGTAGAVAASTAPSTSSGGGVQVPSAESSTSKTGDVKLAAGSAVSAAATLPVSDSGSQNKGRTES